MLARATLAAALLVGAGHALGTPMLIDIGRPGTTLGDVLDAGGRFRVGDKLFTITNYFSVAFAPETIGISPLDFGNDGRGFRLSDAWVDGTPGDTVAFDFTLSYTVEIVDDPQTEGSELGFIIVDNRLDFDGFATGPGSFARVDETVLDEQGNLLGEKSVWANGNGSALFEDRLDFSPELQLRRIHIVKDAAFFAPMTGGTAGASFIDQTFSQIPTPGALGLAVVGGLLAWRRRR